MTNLTFAELTALIAANGLTINDRYFITDKNWTIIAIATNAYRVVVPIVTEVTKAQLDALVAANGLNEGLQYKVTDKGWLLVAITDSTLSPISGILYINNEDIDISFIICDKIFINTGVIDTDISIDPLTIYGKDGYESGVVKLMSYSTGNISEISLYDEAEEIAIVNGITLNSFVTKYITGQTNGTNTESIPHTGNMHLYATDAGIGGIKVIVELNRI